MTEEFTLGRFCKELVIAESLQHFADVLGVLLLVTCRTSETCRIFSSGGQALGCCSLQEPLASEGLRMLRTSTRAGRAVR